jgi:hypothetical protein
VLNVFHLDHNTGNRDDKWDGVGEVVLAAIPFPSSGARRWRANLAEANVRHSRSPRERRCARAPSAVGDAHRSVPQNEARSSAKGVRGAGRWCRRDCQFQSVAKWVLLHKHHRDSNLRCGKRRLCQLDVRSGCRSLAACAPAPAGPLVKMTNGPRPRQRGRVPKGHLGEGARPYPLCPSAGPAAQGTILSKSLTTPNGGASGGEQVRLSCQAFRCWVMFPGSEGRRPQQTVKVAVCSAGKRRWLVAPTWAYAARGGAVAMRNQVARVYSIGQSASNGGPGSGGKKNNRCGGLGKVVSGTPCGRSVSRAATVNGLVSGTAAAPPSR